MVSNTAVWLSGRLVGSGRLHGSGALAHAGQGCGFVDYGQRADPLRPQPRWQSHRLPKGDCPLMTQRKFSQDSLLLSATPEQRVVIAFSMLDVGTVRAEVDELFAAGLNWPWIIMQAMHHRTIGMLWEALKRHDMVRGASKS